MIDNASLVNAIVSQANTIKVRIMNAEDAAQLEQADMQITFVADVWDACGYAYKLRELRLRVKARAVELYDSELVYLSNCRKNDRTIHSSRMNLGRLKGLACI